MNSDAMNISVENTRTVYSSANVPNFHVRPATKADDEQLVQLIAETMPSNGMTLAFERYPSYLVASHAQYNRPDIRVVVPDNQPDKIVGMMNLGWKYCYINQQPDVLRYVADLRLNQKFRGQNILRLLMDYLRDELPQDSMLESIILVDNLPARRILHETKTGFPSPYFYDDIQTFTVSKVQKPAAFDYYQFEPLSIDKIADANAFVQSMKAHYNFLPNYKFSDLAHGEHPFWLGMKMDDFYLIYNHENKMVGIYGLWNQQSFKQTKVVHYSWLLKFIRPFYNLYAGVKGALVLPKKERAFDYLMLHSALCHPSDKEVFSSLLFHAQEQTRLKRKNAFCITLAKTDPRIHQMSHTSSHVIHAIHAFHSFQGKPYELFDGSKISYFETGRI